MPSASLELQLALSEEAVQRLIREDDEPLTGISGISELALELNVPKDIEMSTVSTGSNYTSSDSEDIFSEDEIEPISDIDIENLDLENLLEDVTLETDLINGLERSKSLEKDDATIKKADLPAKSELKAVSWTGVNVNTNKQVGNEAKSVDMPGVDNVENKQIQKSNEKKRQLEDQVETGAKPVKRKRRKRAKTAEEKLQRAVERKQKNRESAMRSRQRMLDQMERSETEVKALREENDEQKDHIKTVENNLLRVEKENARLKEEIKLLRALHLKSSHLDLVRADKPDSIVPLTVDCYNEKAIFGLTFYLIISQQLETVKWLLRNNRYTDLKSMHCSLVENDAKLYRPNIKNNFFVCQNIQFPSFRFYVI